MSEVCCEALAGLNKDFGSLDRPIRKMISEECCGALVDLNN